MKNFLLLITVLVIFNGCQTTPVKKQATPAPPSFVSEFKAAKALLNKNSKIGLLKLNQLIDNNPENNYTDDALFLMGTTLEKQGRNAEAVTAYLRIIDSSFLSPLDGKAILRTANLFLKNKKETSALTVLNKVDEIELQDKKSLYQIEKLRAPLLFKNKLYKKYLQSSHNLASLTPSRSERTTTLNQVNDLMRIKFTEKHFKEIIKSPKYRLFKPLAILNLAEFYFEKEQPGRAQQLLNAQAINLNTKEYKEKALELLERAKIYESFDDKVIGVILPMSGRYQSVGKEMLKGIQISFGIWNQNRDSNFRLSIMDSEASAERTKIAFDQIMKEDRPIAIIGGLISKTAEVIVSKSEDYKVPSFILSQKSGLTNSKRYAFQGANSIDFYTEVIASTAYKVMGIKKMAVLKSNEPFSSEYSDSFIKNYTKIGGEIIDTIEYDLSQKYALPSTIKALVQLDNTEGREEEFEVAMEKWKNSKKGRGAGSTPRLEDVLEPKIEFEGLFIADGAKTAGLIASTLAYFDVENIPLIGTHLWNSPDLVQRGQRFVEGAVFATSYYDQLVQDSLCGRTYSKVFNEPISSYSYKGLEAGQILRSAYINDGASSRRALMQSISGMSTFQGCLGEVQKHKQNFLKPLFLLSVKDKQISMFDPNAPADSTKGPDN